MELSRRHITTMFNIYHINGHHTLESYLTTHEPLDSAVPPLPKPPEPVTPLPREKINHLQITLKPEP